MGFAQAAATRSTCDRAHVGSILVKDRQIIATGYNGAVSGTPHCDDVGHLIVGGHCLRSVHSECNSVISAARRGIAVEGATCYTTHLPCWPCYKALAQAGVEKAIFIEMKLNGFSSDVYTAMLASPMALFNTEGKPFSSITKIHEGQVIAA